MELEFTDAILAPSAGGTYLMLRVSYEGAQNFLRTMQEGKTYIADLKEKKRKRSLDANAFYWELCGRLARTLNVTPEELYRTHIRDLGNYETLCIKTEAVKAFAERWCSNHYGRQISTRGSKLPGCTTVMAYYGSSDFDRTQMSHLLDNLIQDCKACGIETRPKEEVESLLAQWDA